MKKIICMSVLLVFLGVTGVYTATTSVFKGLVINTSDASVEIKKGPREITVYWTDRSKVIKNGKEADRTSIAACQKVKATYAVKDSRRELIVLEILSESYCVR
jgi:NAD/NADP transhydrogenase alpha subunit